MVKPLPLSEKNNHPILLETSNLTRYYGRGQSRPGLKGRAGELTRSVDGVSLTMEEGKTLGLVGESGCGKSTLARLILRLEEPTSGAIYYRGQEITAWRGEKLRRWRRHMQVVFQDTHASLNPRMKVARIIEEPISNFFRWEKVPLRERVAELLEQVGLQAADGDRYPHQFSGGQRQRIAIARAMALNPGIVVCDEAVASLDLSIQGQILNLLKSLGQRHNLSYLFISHDLAAVEYISHRVAIMYAGKIVEIIAAGRLREEALHPYTHSLLAAIPSTDPDAKLDFQGLVQGEPPDPSRPPSGCRFWPRCPRAEPPCREKEPPLQSRKRAGGSSHLVACHHLPS